MANDINTCTLGDCYSTGCQGKCETKEIPPGIEGVDYVVPEFKLVGGPIPYGKFVFEDDDEADTCNMKKVNYVPISASHISDMSDWELKHWLKKANAKVKEFSPQVENVLAIDAETIEQRVLAYCINKVSFEDQLRDFEICTDCLRFIADSRITMRFSFELLQDDAALALCLKMNLPQAHAALAGEMSGFKYWLLQMAEAKLHSQIGLPSVRVSRNWPIA